MVIHKHQEMIRIYGIVAVLALLAVLMMAILIIALLQARIVRSDDQKVCEFISNELIEFLEKADDAYILTHETLEISYFSKYASNSVCNGVLEAIYKNPPTLFGTKNYRKRTWSFIKQEKNEILLRKEITHTYIEVKRGIKIALGDQIVEIWRISLGPKGFLVEDVS